MYSYRAYGLGIHSTLPLPELSVADGDADLLIRQEALDPRLRAGAPPNKNHLLATDEGVYLFWPDVGGYLIREGREILVDPLAGVDARDVRLYLLGRCMAIALRQRGNFVLHASAIRAGDAAVAFAGFSGEGKSSMATAMYARGYDVVVDDVVAICPADVPTIVPGYPQVKLWPDSAAVFEPDPASLSHVSSDEDKLALRVAERFNLARLPLRCIYVLAEGEARAIEPLTQQQAFVELVRHSYASRAIRATRASHDHFRHCTQLSTVVPVRRLVRPLDLAMLPAVATLVEADLARVAR